MPVPFGEAVKIISKNKQINRYSEKRHIFLMHYSWAHAPETGLQIAVSRPLKHRKDPLIQLVY